MSTTLKSLIAFVLAAGIAAAIYGAYQYPRAVQLTAGSSTGTTFNSAKIAAVVFTPATGSATSTSILNNDASDRKIESFVADCSGVGTSYTAYTGAGLISAGLEFSVATTSTSAPAIVTNTNKIVMQVATTSPDVYNIIGTGTTTPTGLQRVWAAGSYLTFFSNATNTASCVVGVHYLAS